ncbi:hypothetical protein [Endozoicomonas sp. Mp262]|uniref:phage adaptor protein n=1 Tax=Endozoicomonas sp. Mp262 TaxID=2919499 RepID=UPI0021DA5BAE
MDVIKIISRVRRLLQDGDGVRWTNDDLLACYNEAQIAVVQNRPDTYSQVVALDCENRSRQTVPDTAYRLMDIIDNAVSGRAVVKTDRDTLDGLVANWSTTAGNDVEQFIYDEKSPGVFYVYPVPPASHQINILISRTPTPVAITDFDNDTTAMELDTVWLNPVLNYMLYRAYMIDGETEANMMQAQSYLKMFANDLQLKWAVDLVFRKPQQGEEAG